MTKIRYPELKHLGIFNRYTYVLKTLKMGRALVAVKMINGAGYDPLREREGADAPYVEFANIDCTKEEAILDYANRRGVPFNPNQVYKYVKAPINLEAISREYLKLEANKPSQAASRAATGTSDCGIHAINLGELLEPHEIQIQENLHESMGLGLYRKTASETGRGIVYPLEDFWHEVDRMRHVLEQKGVVEGVLPSSKHAPGPALSAEYLSSNINHEIAGVKVATFVEYKLEDQLGEKPAIIQNFVPIDFKQALYSALLEDIDARVRISRCAYKRCRQYFVVDRQGKVYCSRGSKGCQNKAARMRNYYEKKGGNNGKIKREG